MSQPSKNVVEVAADHGFKRHASGLMVPSGMERKREVWTHDETKLVRRLDKLLGSRGVKAVMLCSEPACHEKPLIETQVEPDGTTVMVCGCKRREMR